MMCKAAPYYDRLKALFAFAEHVNINGDEDNNAFCDVLPE